MHLLFCDPMQVLVVDVTDMAIRLYPHMSGGTRDENNGF
jgi:hypothetical protein